VQCVVYGMKNTSSDNKNSSCRQYGVRDCLRMCGEGPPVGTPAVGRTAVIILYSGTALGLVLLLYDDDDGAEPVGTHHSPFPTRTTTNHVTVLYCTGYPLVVGHCTHFRGSKVLRFLLLGVCRLMNTVTTCSTATFTRL
jgi:hypothetical protein